MVAQVVQCWRLGLKAVVVLEQFKVPPTTKPSVALPVDDMSAAKQLTAPSVPIYSSHPVADMNKSSCQWSPVHATG